MARTPPPPGVEAYVTGPAAIASDMGQSGEKTVLLVTAVSLAVIFIMLLFVYRSIITVILLLLMVVDRATGGARNCRVPGLSPDHWPFHLRR